MLHRKAYKRLLYTLQINTVAAVVAAAALAQAQPERAETSKIKQQTLEYKTHKVTTGILPIISSESGEI